jgi:hypothetical protein
LAEINLTQTEADLLIATPKVKIINQVWDYPSFGGQSVIRRHRQTRTKISYLMLAEATSICSKASIKIGGAK